MKKILPDLKIAGFDIFRHGLADARDSIKPYLFRYRAQDRYPHGDNAFDLIISLGCLHNLRLFELETAVREIKVASEPGALVTALKNPSYHFKRIGLEAGPLSQWLFSELAEAELPVICVETRHMQAVLKAQINKTDRNDARGIAQMMRVGLYRPVHVKTLRSQKLRMMLTHRKFASIEGHRRRERSTGYFTQLRSQGVKSHPTPTPPVSRSRTTLLTKPRP